MAGSHQPHMPNANPQIDGQLTGIEARRYQVAVLLAAHRTQQEIAADLGVADSTVSGDVKVIRQRWRERANETFDEYVAEELAKLDLLESVVMIQALRTKRNLGAVDRALTIMERRARLLGLDAPERIEITYRIEMMVRAFEESLHEIGLTDDTVDLLRPLVGQKLRDLDAVVQTNDGRGTHN